MNTKYKKWTVYRHISPSNKVYIGITCNPVWHRWQNGKGYRGSPAFLAAIKKYGWDNIKHEIVAEGLSEADAKQMEKILISLYKSKNKVTIYPMGEMGGLVLTHQCPRKLKQKSQRQIKAKIHGQKVQNEAHIVRNIV